MNDVSGAGALECVGISQGKGERERLASPARSIDAVEEVNMSSVALAGGQVGGAPW